MITFRPADEDNSKSSRQNQRRNSGQNRGGSVLRAATAMGGRVVPAVEVEESQSSFDDAMAYVPEEILDQVPDDLLDDKHSKQALKHGAFNRAAEGDDDEGGDEADVVEGEEVVELHTENFAPPSSLIEESLVEDDSPFHELDESISAVERVFNEMGESSAAQDSDGASEYTNDETDHEHTETIIVVDTEAERPVLTEHSDSLIEDEDSSSHTPVIEEVEEEPATEIDPITGIYRLKPKAKPEEENSESGHTDLHSGDSNGSEESAFQSAFTTTNFNYEKPFESGAESESSEDQYTQLTLAVPSSDESHYEDNSEQQD